MASNVAAGRNRHPPVARAAVGLLALAVGLLACVQVVGMVDYLSGDDDVGHADRAGAAVGLVTVDVLGVIALGAAAWFLGRFVAGYRPRWLLSAGLVIAGFCLTFVSWVLWLTNFSGG